MASVVVGVASCSGADSGGALGTKHGGDDGAPVASPTPTQRRGTGEGRSMSHDLPVPRAEEGVRGHQCNQF